MTINPVQDRQITIAGGTIGTIRHPYWQLITSCQGAHPANMITVLMSDEDTAQGLWINRQAGKSLLYLTGGETTIDQYPDVCCLQQQGVSPATTPQRSKAKGQDLLNLLVNQCEDTLSNLSIIPLSCLITNNNLGLVIKFG